MHRNTSLRDYLGEQNCRVVTQPDLIQFGRLYIIDTSKVGFLVGDFVVAVAEWLRQTDLAEYVEGSLHSGVFGISANRLYRCVCFAEDEGWQKDYNTIDYWLWRSSGNKQMINREQLKNEAVFSVPSSLKYPLSEIVASFMKKRKPRDRHFHERQKYYITVPTF